MADLGKLQGETFRSEKDVRWIAQSFRELAPQARNPGGKIFCGKVQWIQPRVDDPFTGIDTAPDFAVNAFFPINHGHKARDEMIGYTLKLMVWDEGEYRRVDVASHASRQGDRPQASGARRKLLRMLAEADDTLTPTGGLDYSR
jgi:hypothetical protein